jgi:lysophospholipid acyltransferase (LPLAT)-like uncharacterized protein
VLRQILGYLLGWLVRVLCFTWRVTLVVPDGLFAQSVPLVFAFWHGKQLALQAAPRRRPALVMVSHSSDGKLQASALGLLGFRVIRGSSSRGASNATKRILRELGSGELDAVFAVDGPRGPRERAKPGAGRIASLAHGALVPLGSACSHRIVIGRAWDRFEVPLPFARVAIVIGEPVAPDEPELLGAAIEAAGRRAQALLEPRKFSQKSVEST